MVEFREVGNVEAQSSPAVVGLEDKEKAPALLPAFCGEASSFWFGLEASSCGAGVEARRGARRKDAGLTRNWGCSEVLSKRSGKGASVSSGLAKAEEGTSESDAKPGTSSDAFNF